MSQPLEYEVTVIVRADLIVAWEQYLPGHVADVLATGCFESAVIERGAPGQYRCRYTAGNQTALDRYLAEHATAMRADATQRFPQGVETSRAVWAQWQRLAP
jgi:Domain of unknown function (DUF4286)